MRQRELMAFDMDAAGTRAARRRITVAGYHLPPDALPFDAAGVMVVFNDPVPVENPTCVSVSGR